MASLNETLYNIFTKDTVNEEEIDDLLRKGANINYKLNGISLLYSVCYNQNVTNVKMLIDKGANVNIQNYLGSTPLHVACMDFNVNIVNILIENGANINIQNNEGQAPLHYTHGNYKLSNILIENGANVDIQTNTGLTPLMQAVYWDHYATTKLLLENGANLQLRNNMGRTVFNIALDYNRTKIFEILTEWPSIISEWRDKLTLEQRCWISCIQNNIDTKDKIPNYIIQQLERWLNETKSPLPIVNHIRRLFYKN